MTRRTLSSLVAALIVSGVLVSGCGSTDSPTLGTSSLAVSGVKCRDVTAKDTLVAELVIHSWIASYPLTHLHVVNGLVVGTDAPDLVAGTLADVNATPDALASVSTAVQEIEQQGLPDYGFVSMTAVPGTSCTGVPAWTSVGPTTADTYSFVVVAGANDHSWKKTRDAFRKVCPLVNVNGSGLDEIDPASDGSTNATIDNVTVFGAGVRGNAFSSCPLGTVSGTRCMLSYATGLNWTGRVCSGTSSTLKCNLQ